MAVIKNEVYAITTVKNQRIIRTDFNLGPEADSLRDYLKPMVNDFVRRRVLPLVMDRGTIQATHLIKIRESRVGQSVGIEIVRIQDVV